MATIAFIGSAGIPNRYGGFESFAEHCTPAMVAAGHEVIVTCDARLYPDRAPDFNGVRRLFLDTPANGAASVLHDLFAFFKVFLRSSHIVVLGVSGGLWFPLFRLLCGLSGKRLLVNVDGIEWRRDKFSPRKRRLLKVLDSLAQRFAHRIIYDNEGLAPFLVPSCRGKSHCIAYSGDHVLRVPGTAVEPGTALTVCRIEPENQLELMIEGFLASPLQRYTLIGNWNHSPYARQLRARYAHEPRLALLDPIYDPLALAQHRERCAVYLHGHSVGGTNPSLVEMLFYDCELLCFDVSFNRHTAQDCARFFADAPALTALLRQPRPPEAGRQALRRAYSAQHIAGLYLQQILHGQSA